MLKGRRFVFTSAQNNTFLHDDFFKSLEHFCMENVAQLYVSRFTYNKHGWKKHGGITKKQSSGDDGLWYDPRIEPYIIDEQVKVANGLIFCGELDILPTEQTPLNTLHNYTGPNSGIIPHAKVNMRSLATMKNQPAKLMYTTGTCTQRNYIERKTGQVATFHHVFAALYVEIDADGQWFARQLVADRNGVFYDIDTAWGPGWSKPSVEVDGEVIVTLGDIHIEKTDEIAVDAAFEMMTAVKPTVVTVHDLIDFEPRNHHNLKDPFFMSWQFSHGINSVEEGMRRGAHFMHRLSQHVPYAQCYSVRSNHDQAFKRWLQDPDGVRDAVNARYWHTMNAQLLFEIEQGNQNFDIFKFAMHNIAREDGLDFKRVFFLAEDESLVINGIEHGMHGHRGPNGARGNPIAFRQLGTKANTGHTHSAGIVDGIYTAGVLATLDMGYNAGPSSWTQSNIVTYPSGKRAILTQHGSKWRA
ncbi:hypothetical protein ACWX0O_01820 [Nitrobacteraceae bacterium UC4449_H16]